MVRAGPLFPKPVTGHKVTIMTLTGQELFLAVPYSKPALVSTIYNCGLHLI